MAHDDHEPEGHRAREHQDSVDTVDSGDDPTIRDALARHLRAAGLPADSGVSQRWVRVRMLGVPIAFPNFDARRAVLVRHDAHHLLTGYDTSWAGEGQISAFELVTGCRGYWAAWMFNTFGFLTGLLVAPRRTWRAFVRARRCRSYYGVATEAVLARRVRAARAELGLDRPPRKATAGDALAFAGWVALLSLLVASPLVAGLLAWRLLAG